MPEAAEPEQRAALGARREDDDVGHASRASDEDDVEGHRTSRAPGDRRHDDARGPSAARRRGRSSGGHARQREATDEDDVEGHRRDPRPGRDGEGSKASQRHGRKATEDDDVERPRVYRAPTRPSSKGTASSTVKQPDRARANNQDRLGRTRPHRLHTPRPTRPYSHRAGWVSCDRPGRGSISRAGSTGVAVAARTALTSNGAMPGCLARMRAASPGHVRRREAVAGGQDPAAVAPGDVDVEPVRAELDRRGRVVEPGPGIGDVVGRDRDDGREQRRVATARARCSRRSRGARWRSRRHRPARGTPRTARRSSSSGSGSRRSAPCSMAHSRPAAKAAPLPLLSGPRTRIETMSAAGASAWMIPAQAVPWPTTSIASGSSTTAGSSPPSSTRTLRTRRPPTAGWSRSTPESMMATVTPAPSEPPNAQARSTTATPSGADRSEAARRSAVNGSLQAGRTTSVTASAPARSATPAAVARRSLGVVGEHGEEVGDEVELGRVGPPDAGDLLDERPEPRAVVAARGRPSRRPRSRRRRSARPPSCPAQRSARTDRQERRRRRARPGWR